MTRQAGKHPGHLSFGNGIHQCIGQQLARLELRVVIDSAFYGVKYLPVAW